jgi:hypothetical protein
MVQMIGHPTLGIIVVVDVANRAGVDITGAMVG